MSAPPASTKSKGPRRIGHNPFSVDHIGEAKGCHMARALMGYVGSPGEQTLALEIARLRRRVRELEAEVTKLREGSAELDLELHRMAESAEPALA